MNIPSNLSHPSGGARGFEEERQKAERQRQRQKSRKAEGTRPWGRALSLWDRHFIEWMPKMLPSESEARAVNRAYWPIETLSLINILPPFVFTRAASVAQSSDRK